VSTKRNGLPYIWVSWLTPFIAGERNCWFAPWFQSRHSNIASPEERSVDLTVWTAEHNKMLHERVEELKADGWTVYVEDQNDFKLRGVTATLSGKIDILAIKGTNVLIIDCKTGREKDADRWQVLIYLYAAPRFHPALKERPNKAYMHYSGEVQYKNKRVYVPGSRSDLNGLIFKGIASVAGAQPDTTPSGKECRYCKLSKADCPDRIEQGSDPTTATEDF
jgi:hypothetical protein